jgi:hypothetical protein
VLERIVEDWLTSSNERAYQSPFAQLLASEGYRVLHGPTHHPFEHGKDLVAIHPNGELHAYQLKGGDMALAELEQIQGQLFALAATAVDYPGIDPPRRPDKAFLVTNGRLTPPARDRLRSLNEANRVVGPLPPVEVIEREHLLARFLAGHGKYLPTELANLNELLGFVLSDGLEFFPANKLSRLLSDLLAMTGDKPSAAELRRAVASATLFTAYAIGPWQRTHNHLGVAEGWITLASAILRHVERVNSIELDWMTSFSLTRDAARQALGELLEEACHSEDLVVPDVIDGFVYPARATLVCGYCAAYFISEREFDKQHLVAAKVKSLLLRELEFIKFLGEAAAPHLFMIAIALELLGEPLAAVRLITNWALALSEANRAGNPHSFAAPYHSISDILLDLYAQKSETGTEDFAGVAFSLHIAMEWLTRRDFRGIVEDLWPAVTRIEFAEFIPSEAANILTHFDQDGEHRIWAPETPASWIKLRQEACSISETALPLVLWRNADLLPFVPLIFPYRFTSSVAKALDYITQNLCTVTFPDDPAPSAPEV